MEGEKSLGYIESMHFTAISAELLTDSIASIHFMLYYLSPSLQGCELFEEKISDLSCKSRVIVDRLKSEFVQKDGSHDQERYDPKDILRSIDEICGQIEDIEKYVARYKVLESMKVPVTFKIEMHKYKLASFLFLRKCFSVASTCLLAERYE
jgi:hypothetical protein